MKNIENIKSMEDLPKTAEEFLDHLLSHELLQKKEGGLVFTYQQMIDFAKVFAQIHLQKAKAEQEAHLKAFQYSGNYLLQISNIKEISDERL